MKSKLKFVMAALLGAALGIAGTAVIHAQQTKVPKGYVIAEVNVKDMPTFLKYVAAVPGALAPYGGQFIVQGASPEVLEGQAPQRFTIIEFDSVEKAKAFEASPEYAKVKPLRQSSTTSNIFVVAGVAR